MIQGSWFSVHRTEYRVQGTWFMVHDSGCPNPETRIP